MNVTRDVVLDLLPVYLAGEASPATRALVEQWMARDTELAQHVRLRWEDGIERLAPLALPPDLELRALRRTRRVIGRQRWLFGLGWFFAALSMSLHLSLENGRITDWHFLLRDYPVLFVACIVLAVFCWGAYFGSRRATRTAA